MGKRICVLGAGGTGQTFAADMGILGHDVVLWETDTGVLDTIRRAGGITLIGEGRTGKSLPGLCADIGEALAGAELVVVCTIAERHEAFAALSAPFLRRGQTVFISAGSAASLIFDRALRREKGEDHGVVIGELEGNLYPCRLLRPAQVIAAFPPARRWVAALPSVRTPLLERALEGVLETRAASNVFETALNSPNVVIHLMASLLNLGAIERSGGNYRLYREGLTPSVMRMLHAMNAEKERLYAAFGWTARSPLIHLDKVAQQDMYPEQDAFRELIGPTGAKHRYITEDASTCMTLFSDLGRLAGVPTPLADSLLTLAGALHGEEGCRRSGRTLRFLGLEGLDAGRIGHRLETGLS